MADQNHYDVIIIGTGAGGGTLAHRLAPSGKRILLLERGDWLPRELENWSSHAVFVEFRYQAHETWYGEDGREFHPGINYYVGGNTKFYGAALFRLRERDFGEIRHHDGVSPAWPLGYEDFAPYYAQAEELYHVHGHRGEDPTDPPGDPYMYPAVTHEPRIQQLHDDLERAGLHPYHVPVGVKLDEQDGKILHFSHCIRCPTFDGFPCLVRGKADAQVIAVEPALEHENVELMTGAYVSRLQTSDSGREVTGVVVERDGSQQRLSADIVVSSCGAINSALLLLRSGSEQHPDGLANSSGLVGRNYMRHNNAAFMAVSKQPNPTRFQKTLGFNDFYFESGDDFGFPLGAVQMLGKSDEEMIRGEAPDWAIWKPRMALDEIARHAVDFWLTTEDLPNHDNRVAYGQGGRVELRLKESNAESAARLRAKLHGLLEELDFHAHHLLPRSLYLGKKIPLGGTAHQCGTTVFGADPAASVLDLDCRTHDVENLYVVDGGFFPSSGAVNPALTIMANALRVGERILERLG
jgi:choline dehydrogenase-like flavoprotein